MMKDTTVESNGFIKPKKDAFETESSFTKTGTEFGFENKPPIDDNAKPTHDGTEKSESLKKTLRTFVETSSVKGVPKIFKSKTFIQRILWAICLLIGLSIGIAQLVLLFIQYFSYTTVIATEEVQNERPIFPDISVCNINPVSSNLGVDYSYSDFELDMYLNALPQIFDMDDIQLTNDYETFIFWHSFTAEGYLENLPYEQDVDLAEFNNTLINDCIWTPWDVEADTEDVQCGSSRANIEFFYHSQYGPCFTLKLQSTSLANKMEKFAAYLYLQDIGGSHMYEMSLTTKWSYSSGVKVQVHPRGTLPDMRSARIAAPGQETTLWVEETRRNRMNKPYGDCYEKSHLPNDRDYKYNQKTCQSLCYQRKIIEACGCMTNRQLFTPNMRSRHPFCGRIITEDLNQTYTNHLCSQNNIDVDSCTCKPACDEVAYTSRVDQAPWPYEAHHINFFYDVAYTVPDWERFLVYQNVADYGSYDDLSDIDLIKKNFLQLNVNMGKAGYSAVQDTQKLSIVSLVGALGGILNLWIGITFVTFIEVCDLVYQLIANRIKNRNKGNEVQPIMDNNNANM